MLVCVKNSTTKTEIENAVVTRVLSMYPEEELLHRDVFATALRDGKIDFAELRKQCDVISLPWQLFFLSLPKLDRELRKIEENRKTRLSSKFIAKRAGVGGPSSKRILDRLIRLQNFGCESTKLNKNSYCGSLKGLSVLDAAEKIRSHFGIDSDSLRGKRKDAALRYLIDCFESKQINVCQGVLTNKILPQFPEARSVYKNTSGFAIHDACVPYVFLPSEANPDERDGRQIYTLAYLIALIGLDAYSYVLEKDFKAKALRGRGIPGRIHDIASEVLSRLCKCWPSHEYFPQSNHIAAIFQVCSDGSPITP
ncbi:MAG: hypothetical protein P4L57_05020 [Rhizomicrobium sp.]|nr:hypothetical protein [Rhizomicrobium sp.]